MKRLLFLALTILQCLPAHTQNSKITYYNLYGLPTGSAKIEYEQNQYRSLQLPSYESTTPVDLVMKVGIEKQKLYDARHKWVQDALTTIGNNINNMYNAGYEDEAKPLGKEYYELGERLNKNIGDLSLNIVFNPIAEAVVNFNKKVIAQYQIINSSQHEESIKTEEKNYTDKIKELLERKDYANGISLLTEAYEQTNDVYYLAWRGYVYLHNIRDYDKALFDFSKWIQLKPNDPRAYYNLAHVYRKMGKRVDAISGFTNCIKLDPENLNAYFQRAICKSELEDRNGAISDYDQIIKIGNGNGNHRADFLMGTVYNNKGYCLFEIGKFQEALKWVNMALEISPNEDYIWQSRGEIYYSQGKYRESISDLSKAIELLEGKKSLAPGDDNSKSYYIKGMAEIKLGDKKNGCTDLSKAGELGNADAYKTIKEKCK